MPDNRTTAAPGDLAAELAAAFERERHGRTKAAAAQAATAQATAAAAASAPAPARRARPLAPGDAPAPRARTAKARPAAASADDAERRRALAAAEEVAGRLGHLEVHVGRLVDAVEDLSLRVEALAAQRERPAGLARLADRLRHPPA